MVRFTIVATVTLMLAVPAVAQNLLENPGFDVADQLDGWTCTATHGSPSWSPEDRLASATSGSMMHEVMATSDNRSIICHQCVPVTEGQVYFGSGYYYWPDDPDVSQNGTLRFTAFFYSDPGCATFLAVGPVVQVFPFYDSWLPFRSTEITAPTGAVAADVSFVTWQDVADEPVRARFDDLVFTSTAIFVDGFETGNVSAWSGSVP